jgi:alanyl-tRNA synthetase
MTAQELISRYIAFFKKHDHAEISGKSLIPENDPTVLFTNAGMHPLVPYLLGEPHPAGKRLVNLQKCIRTGDIESVGDLTHHTFFLMLGNWSLGDYFKQEAIEMSFEFLTSPQWLGFSEDNLSVTVFEGEPGIPADEESARIWESIGIPTERIYFLPREDNFWGPPGEITGPCGPDTEMFIDTGKPECGKDCKPGCDCGKYFEIWNDVFMEYNKTHDGRYEPLSAKNVDTGMGVERTVAMLQGKVSSYETALFSPLIESIQERAVRPYGDDGETDISYRIVADHLRAAVFILGDENSVKPSNLGQGYILRRLIRRSIRHGRKLGLEERFLSEIGSIIPEMYGEFFPELPSKSPFISRELSLEEERFSKTLERGEREFEKMLPNLLKNPRKIIPGRLAFRLYDTYGFPVEVTEELAEEHGLQVDKEGFESAFEKHQALSKTGSEKIFKGGLADQGEATRKLHTATHLLHQALRMVLGDHVAQKGSNITSERLRFDFSHPDKMTPEEIRQVEEIVNDQIRKGLAVSYEIMNMDEAKKTGAIALFDEKYGEKVKVYTIGGFSREVCGGPHVENTSELGEFKIVKEQSSSAGVRRIRAVVKDA